jgi:hypothetical protein
MTDNQRRLSLDDLLVGRMFVFTNIVTNVLALRFDIGDGERYRKAIAPDILESHEQECRQSLGTAGSKALKPLTELILGVFV